MSYDRAVALALEIEAALGGEQARAIEVLRRYAERGRRSSSVKMEAVGGIVTGAQHFARATADLRQVQAQVEHIAQDVSAGLAEVQRTSRVIRDSEVDDVRDDDPPAGGSGGSEPTR